jgi:UDP-N-acetylglucosamine--N-acetylmuramyl-(pentapeptide) pyrophosphoryl-undecaprenol N-acetylglucosamine transferase
MEILKKRILIACGGTGGHLAPGIALAQKLTSRGHACEMLISSKQVDRRLTQKYPTLIFRALPATSLGKTHSQISPASLFQFAVSQMKSLGFCGRVIRAFKPDAVVGFGGFVTVSAGVSASLKGIPLYLHEANYKVGRTVRVLKSLARTIYLPPGIEKHGMPAQKVVETGMPLREDLEKVSREEARKALGFPLRGRLVVVLGGSQGAGSLNNWANENLEALLNAGAHLYCIMGPGKGEPREVEHQMPLGQIAKAVFVPFSDQMHLLYAAADLFVARAGAGTIAELIRFATPSILIPYPFAADDHQRANAANLERQGGAVVVDESNLDNLLSEVLYTLKSDTLLDSLKGNLAKIDLGDPALVMTEAIEKLKVKNINRGAAPQTPSGKTSGSLVEDPEQASLKTNSAFNLQRSASKGETSHDAELEEKFNAELAKAKINPEKIKLSYNELLGPKTTFGIGGPARIWAEPTDPKELAALLKISRKLKLPFFCLGRGSNLLALDSGFNGLVIRLSHSHWQRVEFLKNKRLKAYAGVRLKALCGEACRLGLEGFEFMEGIPATLGGALRMNAGAFGGWTFDRVERVCYLTPQGKMKESRARDLKPVYRGTPGLKDSIVIWAILKPTQNTPTEFIRATIEGYQTKRKASQPREPSAGCIFKNPSKETGAGKLIDELGLKNFSIGAAKVSEVHANFIVNTGAATSQDVIVLINQIQKRVWVAKKIDLQPEIKLLGGEWKDYLIKL